MQSTEVLESLSNIRNQVEAHLRNVKEYRAFLAIQTAMDEIAHVGELHSPLESVREGVRGRLNETREYRALLAVEKSITDIAGVLGLLDEITPRPAAAAPEVAPAAVPATEASAAAAPEAAGTAAQPAAPQPSVLAVEVGSPEVTPEPIDVAVGFASSDVAAEIVPIQQAAEIPATETAATHAAEIVVPAELVADVQPPSEPTAAGVEEEVDSLRAALGATPPPTIAQPIAEEATAPLAAAEPQPADEASGQAPQQGYAEPQQPGPEEDPAIAKVA